jgi:tetratricopeptide (TPR) repeat protein
MPTNLNHQLHTLERIDLIRRASAVPELEFLFRHNLTQEAAYQSILLQHRRHFHQQVAQAIESLFPGRLEEYAPHLGYHYFEAGDYPRAQHYYTQAGDAAYRLYANPEAADHYAAALQAAHLSPSPTTSDSLTYLFTRRGRALELSGRHTEALTLYRQMEELARQHHDPNLELAALTAQGTLYAIPSGHQDHGRARTILPQALELAHRLGEEEAQARILWNLMITSLFSGQELEQGANYGRQSLELARKLNLREQLAFTLNDMMTVYWVLGDLAAAETALLESRQLWQELGNLPMLSDNLTGASMLHFTGGDLHQSLADSDAAYQVACSSNNLWGQANSRIFAGTNHLELGRPDRALAVMEEAIGNGERGGHHWSVAIITAELGWLYGVMGAVERGLELTEIALDKFKSYASVLGPWPLAIHARLHLLQGRPDEAAVVINEANQYTTLQTTLPHVPVLVNLAEIELELARQAFSRAIQRCDELMAYLHRMQIYAYRPELLHYQAQAHAGQGQAETALAVLAEARSAAEKIGSQHTLWQILALQSHLEHQFGNPAEAQRLRHAATTLIHDIANHAPPDLRTTFLNLPAVRTLLS